jgi:HPt (histidine-containing phosphotransfer) domain-containing protein
MHASNACCPSSASWQSKWLGNKSLDTDSHEDEDAQETALMDFTRLTLYSDGDESEIKYMIDLFMDCADECLQILISGEEDQQQSWKKAAHRLKGSAANFGATQLSDYCEEAENYSHNDNTQRTILAQRIKENYDEVLMVLFRQYP